MWCYEIEKVNGGVATQKGLGVGNQLEAALNALGVDGVYRLKNAPPKRIREWFGVVLKRKIRKLNGDSWLN